MFRRAKIAVFIDGCFWHGCPEHYRPPNTNPDYWRDKIEGNRLRDQETGVLLAEAGWEALRFWEHEDPEEVANAIQLRLTALG